MNTPIKKEEVNCQYMYLQGEWSFQLLPDCFQASTYGSHRLSPAKFAPPPGIDPRMRKFVNSRRFSSLLRSVGIKTNVYIKI